MLAVLLAKALLGVLFAGWAFAFKAGALADAPMKSCDAVLCAFIRVVTGVGGGLGMNNATVN